MRYKFDVVNNRIRSETVEGAVISVSSHDQQKEALILVKLVVCALTDRCWLTTHSASVALQAFIVRPGRKSRSKDSQGKIKNKLFSLLATISQTTSRHFENVATGALHTVFVRFASFSLQFLCGFDRKGNKWRCRDCLPHCRWPGPSEDQTEWLWNALKSSMTPTALVSIQQLSHRSSTKYLTSIKSYYFLED